MTEQIRITKVDDDGLIHFNRQPRNISDWKNHPVVADMYQEYDGCFSDTRPSWWVHFKVGFSRGERLSTSLLHEPNLKEILYHFEVYAFSPPDWFDTPAQFAEHKAARIAALKKEIKND
jgi:hypothetical protein